MGKLGRAATAQGVIATIVLASLVGACASPYRDAIEIDGHWISEKSWSAAECDSQEMCERILEVASTQLLARWPNSKVADVRFHDVPRNFADSQAVIVSTMQVYNIVFSLADGSRKLETFTCGLDGLVGIASEAYGQFCPRNES